MANVHSIKRRMKSVTNIRQITSAMEMVAASKLQKAQDATFASRTYAISAREALVRLTRYTGVTHPLFIQRPELPTLYVVYTSDRGLAGAYTAHVLQELVHDITATSNAKVIMIGKRGAQLFARIGVHAEVLGVYPGWQHYPALSDIAPIARLVMKQFREGAIGRAVLIYTDFESITRQRVRSHVVLPVKAYEDIQREEDIRVTIEPSPRELADYIVPRFIEVQLYQAALEAAASEHASRMTSMHAASDNAKDVIDSLTLEYNAARQAGITAELAEIAAGAQAVL